MNRRQFLKKGLEGIVIGSLPLIYSCSFPTEPATIFDSRESIYYSLYKDIYRMDYDGSNKMLITSIDNTHIDSTSYVECNNPKISSNGQYLMYEVQGLENLPSSLLYDYSIIYIMELYSKKVNRFTDDTKEDWFPQFSPYNDIIVFNSTRGDKSDIYITDINGNNLKRLTNNNQWNVYPQFSPDGSKILFESHISGDYDIFIMNTDGSNQVQLTNSKLNRNPKFSPDGLQIVYETYWDIYLMNMDGSGKVNLTNDNIHEYNPRFSSDGSKIVFIAANKEGIENREIHMMDRNGQNRTQILKEGEHFEPHFLSNDTKILFAKYIDGHFYIYSINTDGSDLKELARGGNFCMTA